VPVNGEWERRSRSVFLDILTFWRSDDPADGKKGVFDKPTAHRFVEHIARKNGVDMVIQLAGYRSGVHRVAGKRILVPKRDKLVTPKKGDFEFLDRALKSVFDETQRHVFLSWLKNVVSKYYDQKDAFNQCLFMIGPSNTGKSFIHAVTEACVGYTRADPYQFMVGNTEFNRELITSALWPLEDPPPLPDRSLGFFVNRTKQAVATHTKTLRALHQNGETLCPRIVLQISMNDNEVNQSLIPAYEPGIADKFVCLLMENRNAFPVKGFERLDNVDAIQKQIREEIAGFLWYLRNDYVIPDWLLRNVKQGDSSGTRYGVDSWWHPDIIDMSKETSESDIFLKVLDEWLSAQSLNPVSIHAKELCSQLKMCVAIDNAERFGNNPKSVGQKLRELAVNYPGRVRKGTKTNKGVLWLLSKDG